MAVYRGEYVCTECGHEFDQKAASREESRCPRGVSSKLKLNPFLFGTASADELTAEDYIETLLSPCCGDPRNVRNCPLYKNTTKDKKEG